MSHKTVIIPDIHNRWKVAEQIIKNENPDLVVFLGDYFDGFDDNADTAASTARWLADSIRSKYSDDNNNRSKRIHIIGNHDLHYMTDNIHFRCSGYTKEKRDTIRSYNIDWDKMLFYYWLESAKKDTNHQNTGWLCTHAGFTNLLFEQQRTTASEDVRDVLGNGTNTDMSNIHNEQIAHPFLQPRHLQGGTSNNNTTTTMVGGILWCDYKEFKDIPHTKQIFGHTRGPKVRHATSDISEHYCIDTVLHNYAVCKDYDTMTIKDIQES